MQPTTLSNAAQPPWQHPVVRVRVSLAMWARLVDDDLQVEQGSDLNEAAPDALLRLAT